MQELRADALVNSGNTLAAWAELLPAGEAVQMLASAQKAYEAALTQEEDAAVRRCTYTSVAVLLCQQHTTLGLGAGQCLALYRVVFAVSD